MSTSAIDFWHTVLSQDPDSLEALIKLGWMYEWECGDRGNALKYLQRAISHTRACADSFYWLAKVWFHDGAELDKAREALQRALERNAEHVPSLSLLSSVYCDLGEVTQALPLIEKACMLEPSWTQLACIAFEVYRQAGYADRAYRQAVRAVRLGRAYRRVSTPETYSYFEAAVTGRWVDDSALEQIEAMLPRGQ